MSSIAAKAEAILGDRVRVRPAIQGATLRADPQRLTQALVNLLQNVADHARAMVPVRLGVLSESSRWRFEVTDDGGGLPPGDERAVSNYSAPDHRKKGVRDWGCPSSGVSQEPTVESPAS